MRDWTDWRECLEWLASLFDNNELGAVFGVTAASVGNWLGRGDPRDHEHRRMILCLAASLRGQLQGLTARASYEQGPTPLQAPDVPLVETEADQQAAKEDLTDEDRAARVVGVPKERYNEANERLRQIAAERKAERGS